MTTEFLEELVHSPNLLPAEHKAAAQLLQMMSKQDNDKTNVDLDILLAPHMVSNAGAAAAALPPQKKTEHH